MNLKIWWLSNLDADSAKLRPSAPRYLRDQLMSRKGRNGRGRLWIDKTFTDSFGEIYLPLYGAENPKDKTANRLPGGIVIWPDDERFCVGGFVRSEVMEPVPQ